MLINNKYKNAYKIIVILILFCMATLLASCNSEQQPENLNKLLSEFEYTINKKDITIDGIKGNPVSIVMPDLPDGYKIKIISKGALAGLSNLTTITIPFVGETLDGTRNQHFGYIFGADTFADNNSYIPNSLRTVIITGGNIIGGAAFYGCSGLVSITIPQSTTSIGSGAFNNCSNLKNIYIPQSVTSIGEWAFIGCSNLRIYCQVAERPNDWDAFWNYSNIQVFWKATIENIRGNNEFEYSTTNNEITITRYIGNATELNIPNEINGIIVTSIGKGAFYNCHSLSSVTIPDSITNIDSLAFSNCISLAYIYLHSGIKSIGFSAFLDCNLLVIYCQAATQPIGWDSSWCSAMGPIYWNISKEDLKEHNGMQYLIINNDINITRYIGNAIELNIPSEIDGIEITKINSYAFYKCDSLNNVIIGNHVIRIDGYTFVECSNLTSVTIPKSVTNMGDSAFYYCHNLSIYCHVESKPSGWPPFWNFSDRPVIWNYSPSS